ncbi:hypothetical protein D3C71_2040140 [compost metagenome]
MEFGRDVLVRQLVRKVQDDCRLRVGPGADGDLGRFAHRRTATIGTDDQISRDIASVIKRDPRLVVGEVEIGGRHRHAIERCGLGRPLS